MKRALLVVSLLALAATTQSRADDAAIQGVGGAIQPMAEHPSVVMEKMQVSIDLWPDRAGVDCFFVFRNTGPATTVQMGFPESGSDSGRWRGGVGGFTAFATWVDGRPVPTVIEGETSQAGSWERWRVKSVRFARGQQRRVRVRYSAKTGDDISGRRFFAYRIGSGASWKGPIGRVQVFLQVSYDRARWQFAVPPGFRRIGPGRYEFARRAYEPSARDEILISYLPIYYSAGLYGGPGMYGPPLFGRQTTAGVAIFVPVRYLARWLGAELTLSRSSVTLVLGRRQLTIRPGESWMRAGGQRVPLPAAPLLEGGCLFVPVRPLGVALGAEVAYLPAERTARVSSPLSKALSAVLTKDQMQMLYGEYESGSPLMGFAPPDNERYSPEALRFASSQSPPQPWLAAGDFDGDGAVEAALFLGKRDRRGLGLLEVDHDGARPHLTLLVAEADRVTIPVVLRTHPPGLVEYWQEGETTPKSGRLDLRRDGFEVISVGKAATLFYWDPRRQTYEHVTTAD
jgi:hypothetical protein